MERVRILMAGNRERDSPTSPRWNGLIAFVIGIEVIVSTGVVVSINVSLFIHSGTVLQLQQLWETWNSGCLRVLHSGTV